MKALLIFSFALSLMIGEELCCNDLFEDQNPQNTELSQQSEVQDSELVEKPHICKDSSHSEESSHHKNHSCIGCSHAPFMQLNHLSMSSLEPSLKTFYFEKVIFISNPFLDGPFQPPRA